MKVYVGLMLTLVPLWLGAQSDSNWFMGRTDQATVISVSSTAELVETQFGGNYLYPPANVLDGKGSTTWCPGGRGIGQAITIGFIDAVSFDEIQIVNGFAGENDLYLKNNRIKTVEITQVAGKHFQNKDYELADKKATWQSIKFPLDQTAKTITFTIKDVFRGYKYDDTCLSDIRFLYKGKVIPYIGADNLISLQTMQSKALLGANSEKDFATNYLDCLLVNDDYNYYYFDSKGDIGKRSASSGTFSPDTATLTVADNYRYTVNKNRIVTEHTVGYVNTKVSLVFVPDGQKGLTINGVYYHRLPIPAKLQMKYSNDYSD